MYEQDIAAAVQRPAFVAAFWFRVKPSSGCWEWSGPRSTMNYGVTFLPGSRTDKRRTNAHRVAWTIFHGEVPDGLCVLHRCDNPPCCNPKHLFLGTLGDNARDCVAKGRAVIPSNQHGARSSRAKLTRPQVDAIRARSGESAAAIARSLGVNASTVRRVLAFQSWRA